MDLPSKLKKLPIHLYFIATKYLCNNALVEYIRQPNSILEPSNHIPKSSKIMFNGSVIKDC